MPAHWSFLSLPEGPAGNAPVLLVPLPGEAVLTVTGPDSGKFLQGQTTTDFREINLQHARPGACCNLKGRASVSFQAVFWRDRIHLVMDGGLLEATRALLQKYIVFSQARLDTPALAVMGIVGPEAGQWLESRFGNCPAKAGDVSDTGEAVLVRLPGDSRFLLLTESEGLPERWARWSAGTATGSLQDWRLAQIRAGDPQVLAATSEVFQPQELNLQAVEGISYNKGCYTGQEIVARLYFRGKLKHWMHRFAGSGSVLPAPGSHLLDPEGRHAGQVVLSAASAEDSFELLAVVRHDALAGLRPEGGDGQLQPLSLPYGISVKE